MTNPDTDTVFVTMYDPALGNVQVQAPLLAVPTYQSHGWLLLDPNATPPPVATPFLTQAAGDSRYLRAWLGGETLIAGAVRMTADGHIIVRNSNGTTRSTYDGTEAALWTVVGGGVAAVAGLTGSPTAQQIVTALDTPLKAAYALPVAATVTAAGTLVVQKHNPVDATSGAIPMTLPTGASAGSLIAVEKVDSTTNAVTVTGSIRGGASSIALVWAHETLLLSADASGSWWPVSGHKTKTSLDTAYEAKGRAIAYALALGGI